MVQQLTIQSCDRLAHAFRFLQSSSLASAHLASFVRYPVQVLFRGKHCQRYNEEGAKSYAGTQHASPNCPLDMYRGVQPRGVCVAEKCNAARDKNPTWFLSAYACACSKQFNFSHCCTRDTMRARAKRPGPSTIDVVRATRRTTISGHSRR